MTNRVSHEYIAMGDGTTRDFRTAQPFVDGSLTVYVDGIDQTGALASQDGAAGTFGVRFAPSRGEQVEAGYQRR